MQPHTFAYSQFELPPSPPFPDGLTVWRPMLDIDLSSGNSDKVSCVALVDSGADGAIFPLSFASLLCLDQARMKPHLTTGVGNVGNLTYYAEVQIAIPVRGADPITFKTLAGFTAGLDGQGIGLLGQSGFFESFLVSFDHGQKTFTIFA